MRNSFRMTMAGLFALTAFTVSSVASAQVTGYGQSFVTPATPNPVLAFIGVDATGFTGTSTVDFFAEIYQFNGTNTVGSAIFFQSLGTSFNGFSLTPAVSLAGSTAYLLLVRAPSVANSRGATGVADFYPGGELLSCTANVCASPFGGSSDASGFTIRFNSTTVAPEPSAVALLAAGLFAIGIVARRRNRKTFAGF